MSDELKVDGIAERIRKGVETDLRRDMEEVLKPLDEKMRFLPAGLDTHFGNSAVTTPYRDIRRQIVDAVVRSRLPIMTEAAIERFMAKVEGGSK